MTHRAGLVVALMLSVFAAPTNFFLRALEDDGAKQPSTITQLVERLNAAKFADREAAARELTQIGEPALPALRQALTSGEPEVRRRADDIIRAIQANLSDRYLVQTLTGHSARVSAVAFSHDGRRVLTGGWDKTVRLWDVDSGKEIRRLAGHQFWVHTVALAADGRRALSGGSDRTMILWDMDKGKELRRFASHGDEIWEVAFTPDGRYAISACGDKRVRLSEIESGLEIRRFEGHKSRVWTVAVSSDGRLIATGGGDRLSMDGGADYSIRIWDVDSGKELRRLLGHQSDVRRVAFSPDGKRIVSGSFDSTIRIWDVDSGKELRVLQGPGNFVECVRFTPDGRRIVSCSGSPSQIGPNPAETENAIRVWDVDSGKELLALRGHAGPILSLAMSPDGKRIVTGGMDNVARVWRLPD